MIKKYFLSSILFTVFSVFAGAGIGYYYNPTLGGALSAFTIVAILGVLEVSLSFDNAVINASVLKDMDAVWRHRFLTWGMIVAVFGMRLVFPLLIVGVVAHLSPWNALVMAAVDPNQYAHIMSSVHHEVAAFGGTFLLLVALKYFFDEEKDHHWIQVIEAPLVKLGRLEAVEVGLALAVLLIVSRSIGGEHGVAILYSGIFGILTFLGVESIGAFLEFSESEMHNVKRAGLALFIYLEVLDASFSFDGVVGAFAITNNLFIIALGLGVGAMFVRSLTLLMVDKGTLDSFKYLEHGAFWAVAALAFLMFLDLLIPVPEAVTGLVGAAIIGFSVWSSVRANA
jgi:hypothetical protein